MRKLKEIILNLERICKKSEHFELVSATISMEPQRESVKLYFQNANNKISSTTVKYPQLLKRPAFVTQLLNIIDNNFHREVDVLNV